MSFVRLVLTIFYFTSVVSAFFAALKIWQRWARLTSVAMFFAMVLSGAVLANLFRLWAGFANLGAPIRPDLAILGILAAIAECVPLLLAGLYFGGHIKGRWVKGQDDGPSKPPSSKEE